MDPSQAPISPRSPLKCPAHPTSRRRFLRLLGYTIAGVGFGIIRRSQSVIAQTPKVFPTARVPMTADHGDVIKVGILHSLSGSMAIAEVSAMDATMLAIDEINRQGGVLGKRIMAIVEDGMSDWSIFREKAHKLITQDQVVTVFGGWTSASRKAMLPEFERQDHMLWYPVTYEGQECSKNIFYTGALPNQQIEPTVKWVLTRFPGKSIFLVGSDYVYPRVVNTVIKMQLPNRARQVVGEDLLPLGSSDVRGLIRKVKSRMPGGGVIFNSLNGDTNVAFFQQLQTQGMGPKQYPVISFTIAEEEIAAIGPAYLQGHYAAWSYFQTVNTAANQRFVQAFRARYGRDRRVNDAMQSAYTAVYLWKRAVEQAGIATDLERVRAAAIGQRFDAPEGSVVLAKNHHLTKYARIGQIRRDGMCAIVAATGEAVMPQPWNQQIVATRGFACDWSDPTKGGKYQF